jgi:predicted RecB family nuclease
MPVRSPVRDTTPTEMQRLDDGSPVLYASDLTNHLACSHLSQQKRAIAMGERGKPKPADDPHAELLQERGNEYEAEQLAALSEGRTVANLKTDRFPRTREEMEAARERTRAAIEAGHDVIYQPFLFDGRWAGLADFLIRVDGHYEVHDTKLARQVKAQNVHQLSLYNRLLAELQGFDPHTAHLILGDGSVETIDLRRYAALHRRLVGRVEQVMLGPAVETYPEPVPFCAICSLSFECNQRRRDDDHLSFVAGARRDHRDKLEPLGIDTLAELAAAPDDREDLGALSPTAYDTLHHQAALQRTTRDTRRPTRRLLEPAAVRGLALLPEPRAGDVFFDLEGDPYATRDGGFEYLWGWWTADGYEHVWAHSKAAEKLAFEAFIDDVVARRAADPAIHVYHYAAHERSKLGSLAVEHATHEAEVDDLLRSGVLVDLYAVVRQGLQVGEESYSLKRLEWHHGFRRLEKEVREGGGSIIAYETWMKTGEASILESIRAYNEEDCRSTLALRDWLLSEVVPEVERRFGPLGELMAEVSDSPGDPAWLPDVLELIGRLEAAPDAERQLLAHLLLYHRREGKPQWWRYFELRSLTLLELEHERDALSGLVRDESVAPVPYKKSLDYRFTFPAQEYRLEPGDVVDPETGKSYNLVAAGDDYAVLRRGVKADPPSPRALIPPTPIDAGNLRRALVDYARAVLDGDEPPGAARTLLRGDAPRLASGRLGPSVGELIGATLGLDHSVLPVQGPPGTGKTYCGARMAVAAMKAGHRVAVCAQSHAAVQNLLRAIEDHANEIGFAFDGLYKGYQYDSPFGLVECEDNNDRSEDDGWQLVAGTAWLFCRPGHAGRFGRLFIDEAGQFSLANAVSIARCAESVVLLGDPQQLPQVTQGIHPEGSGVSALGHLLGDHDTIPPDCGVLLDVTWRLHPEVCDFVSEHSYERKLHSEAGCSRRRVEAAGALNGAGLRTLMVEHVGCSQSSLEEATAIAAACRELLDGGRVFDEHGEPRKLVASDILVVAPYNLARRCIAEHVPDGVRVGTVDKFQGQEAPVVFFAMTCSSGDDVPRGLDFLFDRNRFNVAVSRAQCLAVLVLNDGLLDADARSLATMHDIDGVCRFLELAEPIASPAVIA